MTKATRPSLHQIYPKGSIESHLVNLPKGCVKSTSRSSSQIGSRQTPIRRSARLHSPEKLKSEISLQLSAFCKKSLDTHPGFSSISSKSKLNASYKMTRQGLRVKSQLKLSRSNFCGDLEEAQIGCRRTPRLASETRNIAFESQQLIPHVIGRRQSLRLLGLDPVSSEDVKQGTKISKVSNVVGYKKLLEVDCQNVNSPILRRSMRLVSVAARDGKERNEREAIIKSSTNKFPKKDCTSMSSQIRFSSRRLRTTSKGVKKRGVTFNITDKEEVAEGLTSDKGDLVLDGRIGDDFLSMKTEEIHKVKRKCEEDNGVENMIDKIENADIIDTVDWTNEQEGALQKAYLMAKPSPHFWKKVSRMVPGKSAQDCFDKIHSSILTPLSSQHPSKAQRKSFSPICNLTLSGIISPQISKLAAGRRHGRTKKLAAQKTVRHLLRKQCPTDQEKAIDRFSSLESSPMNIVLNAPDTHSPQTSSCTSNSPLLPQQPGEKLPPKSKMLSRFKLLSSANDPSPQVLKKIKNRVLHDRYIDQLHHREERRVTLAKKINSGVVCKSDHVDLKTARTTLISDAVSFINHFRESQANPVYQLEEGEYDAYYDGDEDIDGDSVDD